MTKVHLESFEKEDLSQFRISFTNKMNETNRIATVATDLVNNKKVAIFLNEVKQRLGAPNLMVAASLFAKRYSHCIVVPALYAMTNFNKGLNMEQENVHLLNPNNDNPLWLPELFLEEQTVSIPLNEVQRNEWRRDYIKQLFSGHLNHVWDTLAVVGNISPNILWENTAIYVYWLYETVLKAKEDSNQSQIESDFNYLLYGAEGALFGCSENPLLRFYSQKSLIDGENIRVRKTCCFSYEMEVKGTMCKGCPKKRIQLKG